jgi:uncharacterized membrane protein HdeD (DUF308 family)
MIVILIGNWRVVLLRGLVALAFGVAALLWPRITLTAMVLLFGAFVLVDGVAMLVEAIRGRHANRALSRGLFAVAGIAAGILTLVWPGITTLALLFVIAAWAFVTGLIEIAAAIRLRRELEGEWLLILSGVLAIGFAVALAVSPGTGALAITWLIGWFAMLLGGVRLVLAWRLRQVEHELGRVVAPPAARREVRAPRRDARAAM